MKTTITIIFILISMAASSQDILLQQEVKQDSRKPTYGPNLANFIYGYVGLGFPFYTKEGVNFTRPGVSTNFDMGARYKRKFNSFLAMGLDVGITSASFKIKQNEPKTIPDSIINDKEKIQVNSLVSAFWLRINVGRRGNFIGNYLDLGGFGGWNFQKKHKTTNTNEEDEKVKVTTSRLNYIENFSGGLMGRLGSNRYALTVRYRVTDLFKSSYAMPELPRLSVGVELGLF